MRCVSTLSVPSCACWRCLGLQLPELADEGFFCLLLQAYGMGAYDALPVIFQRTSMLMLAHCVPITLVQLGVPELLRLAGEDPELCRLASTYAIRLLPSLYIEALSRCASVYNALYGHNIAVGNALQLNRQPEQPYKGVMSWRCAPPKSIPGDQLPKQVVFLHRFSHSDAWRLIDVSGTLQAPKQDPHSAARGPATDVCVHGGGRRAHRSEPAACKHSGTGIPGSGVVHSHSVVQHHRAHCPLGGCGGHAGQSVGHAYMGRLPGCSSVLVLTVDSCEWQDGSRVVVSVHTAAVLVLWLALAGMQDRARLRGAPFRNLSKCTAWVVKEGAPIWASILHPVTRWLHAGLTTHHGFPEPRLRLIGGANAY